jgi:hypothetical protein
MVPLRVEGASSFDRRTGDRLSVLDWHGYRRRAEANDSAEILDMTFEQLSAAAAKVQIAGITLDRQGFAAVPCVVTIIEMVKQNSRWACR